jgi:Pyruvate/2-oxoglutarate dehydrogenase complex, dihydrolipoamide acyltransferase (E2) component, and related enzymes
MFEYELPDVGEGVAEGEIVAWHVEPGDPVSEDEVLADVETDKAVVDLPSPVDGVVQELHADSGDMVAVGSVVVTIDTDADADSTEETATADADSTEETATADAESVESPGQDGASEASAPEGRVFAPPNVRQLARELGVEIGAVDGSGPSGRVTEADVRAVAESDEEPEPAVEATGSDQAVATSPENGQRTSAVSRREPPESTNGAEPADRDRTLAVPATRRVARELDVALDEVPTDKTRDGGSFVEPEDVRAYAEAQQTAQAADAADAGTATTAETAAETPATAETATDTATAETAAETPATAETAVETPATAGVEDTDRGEAVTREQYRGVRQTIGNAMAESAFTAPHATHTTRPLRRGSSTPASGSNPAPRRRASTSHTCRS